MKRQTKRSASAQSGPAAASGGEEPAAQDYDGGNSKGHAPKPGAAKPAAPAGKQQDWLESFEKYVPILLFCLAAFTRYYRLDKPTGVVFDEYHFGRFTNQYNAGTYLFDIHPPLGKLVLYFAGRLLGYDHTRCGYANIQDQYKPDCRYTVLRATAAAFGSLTAPVIYGIVRQFNGSIRAGILAALLFTFDGLNLTESRLVLIDSQLIFWCGVTLYIALRWWNRHNQHAAAVEACWEGPLNCGTADGSRGLSWFEQVGLSEGVNTPEEEAALAKLKASNGYMGLKERAAYVGLMGLACANCISIKFTGLATPGMVAVESFFALFHLRRPVPMFELLGIAAIVFVIFSFYYRIHFALLPNTGDGDAFMPVEFQRTLVNNTHYDPHAPKPGFWPTMFGLNHEMVAASARIEQRHHWDSVWWEWPLNLRGILYYSFDRAHTYTESVYLLGNPLVIWPVFASLLLAVASLLLWTRYRTFPHMKLQELPKVMLARLHDAGGELSTASAAHPFTRFFCSIGYCMIVYVLNLLPYVAVTRSCFIYHYMPALFYGHIITALLMDKLAGRRWMPAMLHAWGAVILTGYLYYAPWVYAFALTPEGHARRRWLPRWD